MIRGRVAAAGHGDVLATPVIHPGFTIIEVMVALAITMAVIGAVFELVNPAQGSFQAQPEVSDLQQRLRVGVDTLTRDLLMAGAGAGSGTSAGALNYYFAPVMPYRRGDRDDDPRRGVFFRSDTITVVSVPPAAAQTTVRAPTAADSMSASDLLVNAELRCAGADALCGFPNGTHAIVVERSGAWDTLTVSNVQSAALRLGFDGALSTSYRPGSRIAQATLDAYYLKPGADANGSQLMHYDGFRTDAPVLDHVVNVQFAYFGDPVPARLLPGRRLGDGAGPWTTYGPAPPPLDADNAGDDWGAGENCTFRVDHGQQVPRLSILGAGVELVPLTEPQLSDGPWCPDASSPDRFDADLLRIRRIRFTLRVEVAAAALRGPAGLLFARGGTATSGERYVPDQEIRFDVTPRNMNLGR